MSYPLLEPNLGLKLIHLLVLSRRCLIRLTTHFFTNILGWVMLQRLLVQMQNIECRFHIYYLEVGVLMLLNLILHIRVVSILGLVFNFLEHLRVPWENLIH